MKKLSCAVLTALSIFTLSANASNINEDGCNTNIDGEISFANNLLKVSATNKDFIVFNKSGDVTVNGKSIVLTDEQQQYAMDYYNNIETAIPMVVDVTIDALDIANMAISEVFVGFLGEDTKLPELLDDKFTEISTAIKSHVYQNPESITFNSEYFENELGFNDGFEDEVQELKQEILSSFMGEIFVSLGQAMIGGNSNFSDFENRIQKLSTEIDVKADALATQIESKAFGLCSKMKAIDNAETKLQTIKELRYLDIISVSNRA